MGPRTYILALLGAVCVGLALTLLLVEAHARADRAAILPGQLESLQRALEESETERARLERFDRRGQEWTCVEAIEELRRLLRR